VAVDRILNKLLSVTTQLKLKLELIYFIIKAVA